MFGTRFPVELPLQLTKPLLWLVVDDRLASAALLWLVDTVNDASVDVVIVVVVCAWLIAATHVCVTADATSVCVGASPLGWRLTVSSCVASAKVPMRSCSSSAGLKQSLVFSKTSCRSCWACSVWK